MRTWENASLIAFVMKVVFSGPSAVSAFTTASPSTSCQRTCLDMGMFDFFKGAFENEKFDDRLATASHILVPTEEACLDPKAKIDAGEQSFADAAKTSSTCSSGKEGGSLGSFGPGTMVAEFDAVVFGNESNKASALGELVGPIKTQFGYHLIRVDKRFKNTVRTDGSGFF